jgi:hypothetical protein
LEERVDHRSLADQRQAVLVVAADNARPENERQQAEADAQRLDRSPEPKIGPVALKMERQGRGAEALALRDALEVREERNAKALLVKAWQQVRSDIRDLVNQVADQGDRAPDLLKGFRQAVEKARAGNDSMALEIAEATLGVAEEYQAAGKIPAHHSAAIQKAGQERVFSRLREESASKERPHPHKKEKIDSNGVLEEWSTKKKILLTEYRCRAQKLENSIWCKLKEIGDERRENNYKHNKIKTEEPRGIFGSLKRKSYESAMSAWEIASKNINEWKVIREKELKRRQDIVRQFLGLQTTPLMEQAVTAKLKRREPGLAAQIPKAETEMKRQQEEKRRERLTQRQTKTHQRGKGQGL